MNIVFVGTGAPEGNPSPFCKCINCQYARQHKGKNIRSQQSLLINNEVLVDFGPDVLTSLNRLGILANDIKYILITHTHHDHFYPGHFFCRIRGAQTTGVNKITVFGPKRIKKLVQEWLFDNQDQKVEIKIIEPFMMFKINTYTIRTYAITQTDKFAGRGMAFEISNDQKTIFYATDTYKFPQLTLNALKSRRFDVVFLDETFGYDDDPVKQHHNIDLFLRTKEELQELGVINYNTLFYPIHMSHHNPPHDKLVKIFQSKGIIVPWDGMKVDI